MPSLFSRKKKEKKKTQIQDGLAQSIPAFVAVPNSPQPPTSPWDKTQSFPLPVNQLTASIDSGEGNSSVGAERSIKENTRTQGTQIEEMNLIEENESDAGPGYSTVRRMDLPASSSGDGSGIRPLPKIPHLLENEDSKSGDSLFLEESLDHQDPLQIMGSDPRNTKSSSEEGRGGKFIYSKVHKSSHKKNGGGHIGGSANLSPKDPARQSARPDVTGAAEIGKYKRTSRDQRISDLRREKDNSSRTPNKSAHGYEEEEGVEGYTDEEYLPSNEESITISLTLSDEEEESYSLRGYHKEDVETRSPHPTHRPPIPSTRSATPGGHKIKRSPKEHYHGTTPRRPISAPQVNPSLDGIPFIQPSFIQQLTPVALQPQLSPVGAPKFRVTPQPPAVAPQPHLTPQPQLSPAHPRPTSTTPDVYIFSEQQEDGSFQYYSAVSVQPPSLVDPTSPQQSLLPSPPQQHPAAVSKTKDGESGYHSSLAAGQVSHSPTPSPIPISSHALDPHSFQSPYKSHRESVVGTRISKIDGPVHFGSYPRGAGMEEQDSAPPLGTLPGPRLGGVVPSPVKEDKSSVKLEERVLNEAEKKEFKMMKNQLVLLKKQMAEIREENNMLVSDKQFLELEKARWSEIEKQAYSMSGQNVSLNKQLELQREQLNNLKEEHYTQVSQLSGQMERTKNECRVLERELADLKRSHAQLQKKFQTLAESFPAHVTLEEHREVLDDIQSFIDDLSCKNESEFLSHETRRRIQEEEKKSLIYKLTDATAVILKLEKEKAQLYKSNRRAQERIAELQSELECSRDKEISLHQQLSLAVAQTEKAIAEKTTIAKIAKSQRRSVERAVASKVEDDQTINSLERKMEDHEMDSLLKLDKASLILRKSEKDYQHQKKQYQGEISHLRAIIDKKQEQLQQLTRDKRNAEERLDVVWRASISGRPKLHLTPKRTRDNDLKYYSNHEEN